ncbi:FAD-dependent oxidoreductase [Mucilaginibacter ginsenosidivorax]|uniref:FAD-dependent oxidoreductase n=1 Tax=Mucilaginibacter ginsenosidivorax TaxID=862126 RepID=A0A5B8W7G1_9SPHI|nr:FAD-dependent oxidoreductase [Mucilaginibacter ginsenosidivorax]QEC78885.1 FAD-dependent oxidoreductase [Mucilaginibacter ginsenosidivorax]
MEIFDITFIGSGCKSYDAAFESEGLDYKTALVRPGNGPDFDVSRPGKGPEIYMGNLVFMNHNYLSVETLREALVLKSTHFILLVKKMQLPELTDDAPKTAADIGHSDNFSDRSILIVGGGKTAVELATLHVGFHVEVWIVTPDDRLVQHLTLEKEVVLVEMLKKMNINVVYGTLLKAPDKAEKDQVELWFSDKSGNTCGFRIIPEW